MKAVEYLEVGDEVRYIGKDTKLFRGAYGIVTKLDLAINPALDTIVVKWSNGYVYGVSSKNVKMLQKHTKMEGFAFHEIIRMLEKGLIVEHTALYCENTETAEKVLRFKVVNKEGQLTLIDAETEQNASMLPSDFTGKWSLAFDEDKSFLKLTFIEESKYIGLNSTKVSPKVLDAHFDADYATQFTDTEITRLKNNLNKLGFSLKSFGKVSAKEETITLRQESSLNIFA